MTAYRFFRKYQVEAMTLISDLSDPYKFCFYCSATLHVMSQLLQPKISKQTV